MGFTTELVSTSTRTSIERFDRPELTAEGLSRNPQYFCCLDYDRVRALKEAGKLASRGGNTKGRKRFPIKTAMY